MLNAQHPTSKSERIAPVFSLLLELLQRFHRLRFFDLRAALIAGTPLIVIPEIEHGLAEVLNDICAVEMNVFH